jgi:2-methylisocitrate lyase-like PEP mutase family enzyme
MPSNFQHAQQFHDMHNRPGCFLMPNAWDEGSARMLAAAGCEALATTSAGIAFSLGRPDHGFHAAEARVARAPMLERIAAIAASVALPLNADLEAGYGDTPAEAAATIHEAIECGAAGGNLEDFTGDPRAPLFDLVMACERLRAARAAINASGIPFVLVARTDAFLVGHPQPFAEAVRRANAYRAAGADCLYVPGPSDAQTLAALVREIDGPLSVVMGLSGPALTVGQLADLGVRRISIGASLARAVYRLMRDAAHEMVAHGTFRYAEAQVPQPELNQLFSTALERVKS